MKCPKCGALNTEGASFCSLCHEPFEKPKDSERPVKKKAIPKPDTKSYDQDVEIQPHATPGFGILVGKTKTEEKADTKEPVVKIKKGGSSKN